MAVKYHSAVSAGARHPIHQLTYPDAANRIAGTNEGTGATPKQFDVAKQDDDNSLWLLTDTVGPVWDQIMTSGASGIQLDDDEQLKFGSSADAIVVYNTDQTVDTLYLGVSSDSNHIVIAQKGDVAFDFSHAQATDPTLFIHSANQATDEWISATHDGTRGVLDSGTGGVRCAKDFRVDTDIIASSDIFVDGVASRIGASSFDTSGGFIFYTTAQTVSSPIIATGTTANFFLLCEYADRNFDFAHAQTTDPTLFIHSASQATDEWISLSHNQTKAVIGSGTGGYEFSGGNAVFAGGVTLVDDVPHSFGSSPNCVIKYSTAQTDGAATPAHALLLGTHADSYTLLIVNQTYQNRDFDAGAESNPTIKIFSATDPNSDNTQWVSLSHNQTDASINWGTGVIDFAGGSVTASTVTHDEYWEVKIGGVTKKIMLGS